MKILNEMPQEIEPISLATLENTQKNKKLFKTVIQTKNKRLILNEYNGNKNLKLYSIIKFNVEHLYGLDIEDELIKFYDEIENQLSYFLDDTWCTQILIWNNKYSDFSGITPYIIFDYLIPIYGTIMADSKQTGNGKGMWLKLVHTAFKHHLNIYHVNFKAKEAKHLKTYDEFDKLLNSESNPWGKSANHQYYRLAISENNFIQH